MLTHAPVQNVASLVLICLEQLGCASGCDVAFYTNLAQHEELFKRVLSTGSAGFSDGQVTVEGTLEKP